MILFENMATPVEKRLIQELGVPLHIVKRFVELKKLYIEGKLSSKGKWDNGRASIEG